jgi:hypothetical protein
LRLKAQLLFGGLGGRQTEQAWGFMFLGMIAGEFTLIIIDTYAFHACAGMPGIGWAIIVTEAAMPFSPLLNKGGKHKRRAAPGVLGLWAWPVQNVCAC